MEQHVFEFSMEQHIFYISIDYRWRHRKGIAIFNATEVNLWQKTMVSLNKNVFLKTTERLKQEKIFQMTIFLSLNIVSVYLFSAAPIGLKLYYLKMHSSNINFI